MAIIHFFFFFFFFFFDFPDNNGMLTVLIRMSTHNMQCHDKYKKICFLEVSEQFSKSDFESSMVNELNVFESSRLYCISGF